MTGVSCKGLGGGMIIQASLPYKADALEPYLSEKTIRVHYGKHHAGYVKKLNGMIKGSAYADMTIEAIIQKTYGSTDETGIFNNAAQVFNHTFYWNSMKPGGGGEPTGIIAEKIQADFGSFYEFKKAFASAALSQFGSGWAWLVKDGDALKIIKTANADTPIAQGLTPLLTVDVWEHAYYLDYQNRRADYVDTYLEHLVNWEFAETNLAG
ncbi:superoxide dismutase [Desulfobacter hydrogenophilus]|uniref:Superoxide dismutase n=2 Tax=Desulfobacter hydrogenophilus TaxID=2291 RepID=A0A328FBV4_9BACT|nr:superoxide dismutase [Desulfobacter hydrogenophilus]QBH15575.1 superoxide dismutase [Desulfobacter hydrogenophilus]RAM00507.1 superoxide dismutase [Desulfobacter hydrogenophilus]